MCLKTFRVICLGFIKFELEFSTVIIIFFFSNVAPPTVGRSPNRLKKNHPAKTALVYDESTLPVYRRGLRVILRVFHGPGVIPDHRTLDPLGKKTDRQRPSARATRIRFRSGPRCVARRSRSRSDGVLPPSRVFAVPSFGGPRSTVTAVGGPNFRDRNRTGAKQYTDAVRRPFPGTDQPNRRKPSVTSAARNLGTRLTGGGAGGRERGAKTERDDAATEGAEERCVRRKEKRRRTAAEKKCRRRGGAGTDSETGNFGHDKTALIKLMATTKQGTFVNA